MGRWIAVVVVFVLAFVLIAVCSWINRIDDAMFVAIFAPMVIVGAILLSLGMVFIASALFQGLNALVSALENRQCDSEQDVTPRGYHIRGASRR